VLSSAQHARFASAVREARVITLKSGSARFCAHGCAFFGPFDPACGTARLDVERETDTAYGDGKTLRIPTWRYIAVKGLRIRMKLCDHLLHCFDTSLPRNRDKPAGVSQVAGVSTESPLSFCTHGW
jgi:hypothetical protein